MKELSVSALILAFLISGCASVNNSVPETQTAGSETTIPESTESPTETVETKEPSQPTNEEEENPWNPLLFLGGVGIGVAAIFGVLFILFLLSY